MNNFKHTQRSLKLVESLGLSFRVNKLWFYALQGQAVIIPAYDDKTPSSEELRGHNEGVPIKYLISAPTMRVPQCVDDTVNAYLAFRAVILAGTATSIF